MRARSVIVGLLALLLLPSLAAAQQTAEDSLRLELVRSRGFIRAAETQLTKVLGLVDRAPPEPVPPVVMDWRTGEWEFLAGGYYVTLDLDASTARLAGVVAPVSATFDGDSMHVRLTVPGYDAGVLSVEHAEGRMIGTVQWQDSIRPASAQRPSLEVVQRLEQGDCTFALFTDGSYGVAPNTAECHQALDSHAGPLRYVAREYVE